MQDLIPRKREYNWVVGGEGILGDGKLLAKMLR